MRRLSALFILASILLNVAFAEISYVEGEHYQLIPIPVESQEQKATEVVEIFSYGCVHCYNFDPYVEVWKQRRIAK